MTKQRASAGLLGAVCVLTFAACSWKAPCPAAKLTTPWNEMNLPIDKDTAVCFSSPSKFQAAHKADREKVAHLYLDSLEKGGWKLTSKDLGGTYRFDFERGSDQITLEIYDWQKTGVLIKKR